MGQREKSIQFEIELGNNTLKNLGRILYSEKNGNLGKFFDAQFGVELIQKEDHTLYFKGPESAITGIEKTLTILADSVARMENITKNSIGAAKIMSSKDGNQRGHDVAAKFSQEAANVNINIAVDYAPQTKDQEKFQKQIDNNAVTFGIGPAGTGKTRTAIALAFEALRDKKVKKIFLTRPAVDGEEDIGFLPGTMEEKMDLYVRPMFDEAVEVLGGNLQGEKALKFLMEKKIVEILPVGKMRGRNIKDAFLVVDESQNATYTQLKTILTRLTGDTKMVFTGDLMQIDLVPKTKSGLTRVLQALTESNVPSFAQMEFDADAVVRHEFVKAAVKAFKSFEEAAENQKALKGEVVKEFGDKARQKKAAKNDNSQKPQRNQGNRKNTPGAQ